jgi:hypothetical protein
MTETGPYFTTWRPLQHEPFRDPEAIWYPAVQVDRFVAAQEEEIAKLRKELAETLHALHHHDDCNAVKAARAKVEELRKSRDGFARSFLSLRALLLEGALDMMTANDRDYESFQEKVGWAIKESKPAEAEARRALERVT